MSEIFRIIPAGVVCMFCLMLTGCNLTPEINLGSPCDEQHSCPPGQACVQGYCIQEALLPDGDADTIPGDVEMPEADGDTDRDDDNATDTEEYPGVCLPGETRCMGDVVQWCQGGDWADVIDCSYAQQQCRDGQCSAIPVDGDVDTDPDYADQQPDGEEGCIPGERSCYGDQVVSCRTNGEWMIISDCERGDLVCDQGRCVCPIRDRMCYEGDKVFTCHDGVWRLGDDCASLDMQCVDGACWSPEGDPLCSAGLYCRGAGFEELYSSCLDADGTVPDDNRDWCDPASDTPQCFGNRKCICFDEHCQDARCIDMCGQCPSGQQCVAVIDYGLKGCMQNGGIPDDARWGCQVDADCPFNSGCYCSDDTCSSTVCISYCSAPVP